MTRPALRLVTPADDLYTATPAATPRTVGSAEHDRIGVVDALAVVPERGPKSGVRMRGSAEMENWT